MLLYSSCSPEAYSLLEPARPRSPSRNDHSKWGVSSTSTYQDDSTYMPRYLRIPIPIHTSRIIYRSLASIILSLATIHQQQIFLYLLRTSICQPLAQHMIITKRRIHHADTHTQSTIFYVLHSFESRGRIIYKSKRPLSYLRNVIRTRLTEQNIAETDGYRLGLHVVVQSSLTKLTTDTLKVTVSI